MTHDNFPEFNGPWMEATDFWRTLKWIHSETTIPEFLETLEWCGYFVARSGQYETVWAKEIAQFVMIHYGEVFEKKNLKVKGYKQNQRTILSITDKNGDTLSIECLANGNVIINNPEGHTEGELDWDEFLDYYDLFDYLEKQIGMYKQPPTRPELTTSVDQEEAFRLFCLFAETASRDRNNEEVNHCLGGLVESILDKYPAPGFQVTARGICLSQYHSSLVGGNWEYNSEYFNKAATFSFQGKNKWIFDPENRLWLCDGDKASDPQIAEFEREIIELEWRYKGSFGERFPGPVDVW